MPPSRRGLVAIQCLLLLLHLMEDIFILNISAERITIPSDVLAQKNGGWERNVTDANIRCSELHLCSKSGYTWAQIPAMGKLESCAVLKSSNVSEIIFMGDSYNRHLYQATVLTLSGNYRNGTIQESLISPHCEDDKQFDEKDCRLKIKPSTDVCGGSITVKIFTFRQKDGQWDWWNPEKFCVPNVQTFVFWTIGSHYSKIGERTGKNSFNDYIGEINGHGSCEAVIPPLCKIFWVSTHQRLEQTWNNETHSQILAFNEGMKSFFLNKSLCGDRKYIDVFNMTENLVNFLPGEAKNLTFDGAHWGMEVNLLKAQILLNRLKEEIQQGLLAESGTLLNSIISLDQNTTSTSATAKTTSSSPHFVLTAPKYGLANRLGGILAAKWIVETSYPTDTILVVSWYYSEYCTEHFLALFKPLDNLIFIEVKMEAAFTSALPHVTIIPFFHPTFHSFIIRYSNASKEASTAPSNFIISNNDYSFSPRLNGSMKIASVARNTTALWVHEVEMMRRLQLVDTLDRAVFEFRRTHDICRSCALHIRATEVFQQTNLQEFYDLVDDKRRCANSKFFLATDNASTQALFLERYGARVMYYKLMNASLKVNKIGPRQTTLSDAVIEAYIAAHSIKFLGVRGSTFSNFIEVLRSAKRVELCGGIWA